MLPFLLIFLGGGVGAVCRYGVTLLCRPYSAAFPSGTLLVNLLGALLMGMLAEVLSRQTALSEPLRLLLLTGVLGGFTTFSAFSLETANLLSAGRWGAACGYAAASVIGCTLLVFAGRFLAYRLFGHAV